MLEIKRINKYFGDNHVLKNVDLQIQSNKTTVIIGSSGSGKSTLLRCINLYAKILQKKRGWYFRVLIYSLIKQRLKI